MDLAGEMSSILTMRRDSSDWQECLASGESVDIEAQMRRYDEVSMVLFRTTRFVTKTVPS